LESLKGRGQTEDLDIENGVVLETRLGDWLGGCGFDTSDSGGGLL